jgi:hypothetical protein
VPETEGDAGGVCVPSAKADYTSRGQCAGRRQEVEKGAGWGSALRRGVQGGDWCWRWWKGWNNAAVSSSRSCGGNVTPNARETSVGARRSPHRCWRSVARGPHAEGALSSSCLTRVPRGGAGASSLLRRLPRVRPGGEGGLEAMTSEILLGPDLLTIPRGKCRESRLPFRSRCVVIQGFCFPYGAGAEFPHRASPTVSM